MSAVIDIAAAVVTSLNAGSFDPEVEAVRKYVPSVDLDELATLAVTVVPKSLEMVPASRTESNFDCTIDIGIQQKVDPDDLAAADALADLVEQIIDHLRTTALPGSTGARWVSFANEPVFSPEHMDQQRVFTSIVSVTYRARR